MAEAKLGRPNNKKRWGTLVEAAKTANVKKMLSKSRSDESLSSGNEGEQEPLQDDREDGINADDKEGGSGTLKSDSGSGGLSPLDPTALEARHLTDNKYRTIRPPKTSISFDETTIPLTVTNENRETSTDPLLPTSESGTIVGSPSVDSRSISANLAVSESCEPLMTDRLGAGGGGSASTSQNISLNRLSPSTSEPPTGIRSLAQPANGSVQASRLPGIQPINRQMSAGWL